MLEKDRHLLLDECRERRLPVTDLHDEDARPALSALPARGAVLLKPDGAVQPHHVDPPERVADGLRLGAPGAPDRLRDRQDPVVAAEPFGEPPERVAPLPP